MSLFTTQHKFSFKSGFLKKKIIGLAEYRIEQNFASSTFLIANLVMQESLLYIWEKQAIIEIDFTKFILNKPKIFLQIAPKLPL